MPRVTITVPEFSAQPYRFELDSGVVTLGRGSDNDIAIQSGSVSTHHAEMRRVVGGFELCDVGSTNGIKLDGVRYETIPLEDGIAVAIGDAVFAFSLTEEELRLLAREKPAEPSPISQEPEIKLPSAAQKKEVVYVPVQSQDNGFSGFLIFLILAAIGFFMGLAMRHKKETGGALIDAIKAKAAVEQSAPKVTK